MNEMKPITVKELDFFLPYYNADEDVLHKKDLRVCIQYQEGGAFEKLLNTYPVAEDFLPLAALRIITSFKEGVTGAPWSAKNNLGPRLPYYEIENEYGDSSYRDLMARDNPYTYFLFAIYDSIEEYIYFLLPDGRNVGRFALTNDILNDAVDGKKTFPSIQIAVRVDDRWTWGMKQLCPSNVASLLNNLLAAYEDAFPPQIDGVYPYETDAAEIVSLNNTMDQLIAPISGAVLRYDLLAPYQTVCIHYFDEDGDMMRAYASPPFVLSYKVEAYVDRYKDTRSFLMNKFFIDFLNAREVAKQLLTIAEVWSGSFLGRNISPFQEGSWLDEDGDILTSKTEVLYTIPINPGVEMDNDFQKVISTLGLPNSYLDNIQERTDTRLEFFKSIYLMIYLEISQEDAKKYSLLERLKNYKE